MPDPPKQSPSNCGFHGPSPLVVSEVDLRKAVVDAAKAERTRWEGAGGLKKEDDILRFPDLVAYWLAGMDSNIRPDWLQALKAATGKVTYGNLANTQLNADILAFNAADTLFETAIDNVYLKSGEVDAARTALKPLEGAAATAVSKARNAKTALDKAKNAKPKNQPAIDAAQAALTAAEQDKDTKVAARDSARSVLRTKESELKRTKADVATRSATRKGLIPAAQSWSDADREAARQDLFTQSATTIPKKIETPVHKALTAAHNSRADTEPWSSAFVGATIRAAAMNLGIEAVTGTAHHGKDVLLKVSRRHSDYILDARKNPRPGRYQAFEPAKRAVQIGDIVCTDRADFITKGERQTLKGLTSGTILHGDIVVSVVTGANGFAQTVGGNVGQTVRQRRYPIGTDGKLIVREEELIDQENHLGLFSKGGSLGPFETLPSKPSMVHRASSFRVFALLSPVEKCKAAPKGSRELFDLESPFLEEAVFVGEGEDEFASTATEATKLESPFLTGLVQPSENLEELDEAGPPDAGTELEGGFSGIDDRSEVGDTTIPPYRWICSVSYEKDGQTLDGGTGFLISNRHVLTAAHVITDAASGPGIPSVFVYPGRHYGGEPFGRFSAARTRVSAPALDFGLITLNRPVDVSLLWWGHPSTRTAWWTETAVPHQQLLRTAISVATAGYPGDRDRLRRRMVEAKGATMPGAFGAVFRHTADTTKGQSGSPIWTVRNGVHILLGIATSYDDKPGQRGTWAETFHKTVNKWMAEDAPKARKPERRFALEIPYRWVCRLEVYDNDLQRVTGYGTGLLISERHVLTSARVIHDLSRDRRRFSVRVSPGYEFNKQAFDSTTASRARVSPKFSPAAKDGSADYGLLTLSRSLGSALGSWGGEQYGLYTRPADLSGKTARLAAFSRESGGGAGYHKLRVSSGAVAGVQRGQILHKAGSKLDAPGAPIWIEDGKRRLLVGVASSVFGKDSGLNYGCYLTTEAQNQLMQWVNADHEQKEFQVDDSSSDELEHVLTSPDAEEEWSAETDPEPDPKGEYLEAESLTSDFGDAGLWESEDESATDFENDGFEHDAPAAAKLSAFPVTPLRHVLKEDRKLAEAFREACDSTKTGATYAGLPPVEDIPIVIVALLPGGSRPFVSQLGDRMYYSGSLLKVAAMYAAYQLHVAVNNLAATPEAAAIGDERKLFNRIRAAFDTQIDGAVPLVSKARGVTRAMRIPKYEQIFKASKTSGGWVLSFKDTGPNNFAGHLRTMIVGSNNASARVCIQALGYSWINGLLQKAGLFKADTKRGIWLAGAYDAKWTTVDIPTENDGNAKQVTNCIEMAKLFVLLHDNMLVKDDASSHRHADMLSLLSDAVDNPGGTSMKEFSPGFTILQNKIGIGHLKRGSCRDSDRDRCVSSEAAIVKEADPSGRKFVVVWQNLTFLKDHPAWWGKGMKRIAHIIEKTMEKYKP